MLSKLVCTLWAASALAERAEIRIIPKMTQEQAERQKQSREGFFEVRREMSYLDEVRINELEEITGKKLVMVDPVTQRFFGSCLLYTEEDLCREEMDQLNTALNALSWVDKAHAIPYDPIPPQISPPSTDFLLGRRGVGMPPQEKSEDKKFELR